MYHVLDSNPQHITTSLLKEFFTVIPLMAADAVACKLLPGGLPWPDLLCMPLTCLIRPPSSDDIHQFERKMTSRCGGDFNRNLASACPVISRTSKRDIHCDCRCMMRGAGNFCLVLKCNVTCTSHTLTHANLQIRHHVNQKRKKRRLGQNEGAVRTVRAQRRVSRLRRSSIWYKPFFR